MALFAAGCGTLSTPWLGGAPRHRIIAYIFGGRVDFTRVGAHKLTHINYAFGLVSEAGEVVLQEPAASWHLAQLQALKAKNPRLKLILSIGGWGADNFSDAALSDASRRKFAASALEVLKRYALDGIDLDWEYPGQPGPGIKHRAEDRENFTLMLKTMRENLDALSDQRGRIGTDRYTLTIASSGSGEYFAKTEMDRLHVYLDWINIMTYDFAGSWTRTAEHHANLWPSKPGNGVSAVGYVKQHLRAGISSRKLVLGVPFYGRGWSGVHPESNGLHQRYEGSAFEHSFPTLLALSVRGFERHWDREAKAPYLWDRESRTLISYDDPQSLTAKTRFIKRYRLGGVMYWEHSHDPEEILLDVLYYNLR